MTDDYRPEPELEPARRIDALERRMEEMQAELSDLHDVTAAHVATTQTLFSAVFRNGIFIESPSARTSELWRKAKVLASTWLERALL